MPGKSELKEDENPHVSARSRSILSAIGFRAAKG
jgi:hypothetical protein